MWEIKIIFLMEESFKMFTYFLYNFHLLFHLKVSKISFLNSRYFSHTDDHHLQETSSELVEHRSSVGVWGHLELHPPVKGAGVAIHHVAEVLADSEGLGHALCRWVVGCGGVVVSQFSCDFPCCISIFFGSKPTIYSFLFAFIFFHSYNFKFFLFKHKILKIKEF